MLKVIGAVVAGFLISGCATKYGDMGFAGGVEAQRLSVDSYRIVSRGNGYTAHTTIQDYALLKAAETTKAAGGTHFLVMGADDATSAIQQYTPGTAHTSFGRRTAFTTFTPGYTQTIVKPGADFYIRVITIAPGQPLPERAQSAEEIIQFIGSRVERPTDQGPPKRT